MDWRQAKSRISAAVGLGTRLGRPNSSPRDVVGVERPCMRYGYGGEAGFIVRIGVKNGDTIDVPWSMLRTCYGEMASGSYSGEVFRRHYPKQASTHGCHIHVVGMMFVVAGLAVSDGRTQARYRPGTGSA